MKLVKKAERGTFPNVINLKKQAKSFTCSPCEEHFMWDLNYFEKFHRRMTIRWWAGCLPFTPLSIHSILSTAPGGTIYRPCQVAEFPGFTLGFANGKLVGCGPHFELSVAIRIPASDLLCAWPKATPFKAAFSISWPLLHPPGPTMRAALPLLALGYYTNLVIAHTPPFIPTSL